MNQASNESGRTNTTTTLLDDINSSISSISIIDGRNGIYDLDPDHEHDASSNTTISQNSQCYTDSMERMKQNGAYGTDTVVHRIYNYGKRKFVEYEHLRTATCEDICIDFSRDMDILPNTRYLFGLRVFEEASNDEWCPPGEQLQTNATYCFRIRFKIPSLDVQLRTMDAKAFEYIYNQMRYDMVHECIPAIKYPLKKDNVMGLGAVNMYIDLLEQRDSIERIESNYKRYLPRRLLRAHNIFIRGKICKSFRLLRQTQIDLKQVKWHYVHEINTLATDYLLETFIGVVDFIPGDIISEASNDGIVSPTTTKVYIKLDLYDTPEPGLKVARITSIDKMEAFLVIK